MLRNVLLIAILLALPGCGKPLGWTEIGRVDAGILYTDSSAIVKTGPSATGWVMIDFKTPQTTRWAVDRRQHLSAKSQHEYDCAKEQWRTLSIAYYSGHMGTGDMISATIELGEWKPAVPGSSGKTLLDAACGKS